MVKIKNINDRNMFLGISIISILTIIIAFMLEKFGGFIPCFLCWTQRFVFGGIFIASTITYLFLHFKKPPLDLCKKVGASLVALLSLTGIGFALRHIYVIFKPPATACGFGPDMAFEMLPFFDAIQSFLVGGSSCSNTDGVLGIPFPFWALMIFALLFFLSFVLLLRKKTSDI